MRSRQDMKTREGQAHSDVAQITQFVKSESRSTDNSSLQDGWFCFLGHIYCVAFVITRLDTEGRKPFHMFIFLPLKIFSFPIKIKISRT